MGPGALQTSSTNRVLFRLKTAILAVALVAPAQAHATFVTIQETLGPDILFSYSTIIDVANNTNGTIVGSNVPIGIGGLAFDGSAWYTIQYFPANLVFSYPTISDIANNTNGTVIGSNVPIGGGLAFDGSAWYTIHYFPADLVFSYPTITDVANNTNGTLVGSNAATGISGLTFDDGAWYTIQKSLGSNLVFSYPTISDVANNTNGTLVGSNAAVGTRALAPIVAPEPSTALLLASGLVAMAVGRKMRIQPTSPARTRVEHP